MLDLYRLAEDSPDPVIVERFFGDLETSVAPILRRIDEERRPPSNDELDMLLEFMAFQFVRIPRFVPSSCNYKTVSSEKNSKELLRNPETWRAALTAMGEDPNHPGADCDGMMQFLEGREFNLNAETEWYLQRAFTDVDTILACLLERYGLLRYKPPRAAGRF